MVCTFFSMVFQLLVHRLHNPWRNTSQIFSYWWRLVWMLCTVQCSHILRIYICEIEEIPYFSRCYFARSRSTKWSRIWLQLTSSTRYKVPKDSNAFQNCVHVIDMMYPLFSIPKLTTLFWLLTRFSVNTNHCFATFRKHELHCVQRHFRNVVTVD